MKQNNKNKQQAQQTIANAKQIVKITKNELKNLKKFRKFINDEIKTGKPMERFGKKIGSKLGTYAGKLLGNITGTGDYNVDLPTGGSIVDDTMVPQFIKSDNSRETRIRHREFVGNVFADATAGKFKNQSFAINPGVKELFPWLADIARHYDQWKPNGIVVIFKTLTSTYAASQSLGTVIIASEYDVYDPKFTSKVQMANSEFAVSGNAAQNLLHPVECAIGERMTDLFTVYNGNSYPGDNKRFFDLANLQIASEGCLANQLLGELWVTYDISLYKPQIPTGVAESSQPMNYTMVCKGTVEQYNTSPFSAPRYFNPNNSDIIQSITPVKITFKEGFGGYTFLITLKGAMKSPSLQVTFTSAEIATISEGMISGPDLYDGSNNVDIPGDTFICDTPSSDSIVRFIYQRTVTLDPDAIEHSVTFEDWPTEYVVEEWNYGSYLNIAQINPNGYNKSDWITAIP